MAKGSAIAIALAAALAVAPAMAAPPPAPPALPTAPARAKPKEGEITYSYYLISCGSYVGHRQTGVESNYTTADTFYVAGWLSAYNRLKPDADIPDDTTLDDIMLWLEQYCRKNPLSNVEEGLFVLADEVKPRHEDTPATPPPSTPPAQQPLLPQPRQASPQAPAQLPFVAPKPPSTLGLKPLPY